MKNAQRPATYRALGPRLPARPARGSSARSTACRRTGAAGPDRAPRCASARRPCAGRCSRRTERAARVSRGVPLQAHAAARTPSPLVAQCSRNGASRLPLCWRSTANTTPGDGREHHRAGHLPRMTGARVPSAHRAVAALARAPSTAGSTCHEPEEHRGDGGRPERARARPRAAPTAPPGRPPPRGRRRRAARRAGPGGQRAPRPTRCRASRNSPRSAGTASPTA